MPVRLHDLDFVPLISEAIVQERVRVLGSQVSHQYAGKNPLFVSVLSGAFIFAADLMREFEGNCEVNFVKISSYAGTASSGSINTILGLEKSQIEDRSIIVVEDIVDTGRTLHFFLETLKAQNPASVEVVAFLRKPDAMEFDIPIEKIGFDIENRFVVGYGLDYNGLGRNLKGIYVLSE
jgi:hypoxanthine phosphoribosyltransferase